MITKKKKKEKYIGFFTQQNIVQPYKDHTTDPHNNIDESHRQYVKQKEPDTAKMYVQFYLQGLQEHTKLINAVRT